MALVRGIFVLCVMLGFVGLLSCYAEQPLTKEPTVNVASLTQTEDNNKGQYYSANVASYSTEGEENVDEETSIEVNTVNSEADGFDNREFRRLNPSLSDSESVEQFTESTENNQKPNSVSSDSTSSENTVSLSSNSEKTQSNSTEANSTEAESVESNDRT